VSLVTGGGGGGGGGGGINIISGAAAIAAPSVFLEPSAAAEAKVAAFAQRLAEAKAADPQLTEAVAELLMDNLDSSFALLYKLLTKGR
jgi:hypothetical protein